RGGARREASSNTVVRATTSVSGSSRRITCVAVIPSIAGMSRSMSTTSGCDSCATRTASAPSWASPTTSNSGSSVRNVRSPCRTTAWSSAMRMRMAIALDLRHARSWNTRISGDQQPEQPDRSVGEYYALCTLCHTGAGRPADCGANADGARIASLGGGTALLGKGEGEMSERTQDLHLAGAPLDRKYHVCAFFHSHEEEYQVM